MEIRDLQKFIQLQALSVITSHRNPSSRGFPMAEFTFKHMLQEKLNTSIIQQNSIISNGTSFGNVSSLSTNTSFQSEINAASESMELMKSSLMQLLKQNQIIIR